MSERALLVCGPSSGGIRRHVAALAVGLAQRGWEVQVAGPRGVFDRLEVPRAPLVVEIPGGLDPRALRRARAQLSVAAAGTHVVHAHGLRAGWVAALARRHAPVCVTVHNLVLDEAAGRTAVALRVLERRLPAMADATIAVSTGIADALRPSTPAGRLHVVPPVGPTPVVRRAGAEVRAEHGIALDAPLVVTVARLHPQKGLGTLLEAASLLRARLPGLRVLVVGDGPLADDLRRRRTALGLDDVVVLAGARPTAFDELAAADVVCVPSIWESGPLVVAEALQVHRAVVSTPVGFVPRLLRDAESARIVPVGDAAATADALLDVLRDPVWAATLAEAGRRQVLAELGPAALVGGVEAVYWTMLTAP